MLTHNEYKKDVAYWLHPVDVGSHSQTTWNPNLHSLPLFHSILYFPIVIRFRYLHGIRVIQELTFIDPWPIFSNSFCTKINSILSYPSKKKKKIHSKAPHHRSQILSENWKHRFLEKPSIRKTHVFRSPSATARASTCSKSLRNLHHAPPYLQRSRFTSHSHWFKWWQHLIDRSQADLLKAARTKAIPQFMCPHAPIKGTSLRSTHLQSQHAPSIFSLLCVTNYVSPH